MCRHGNQTGIGLIGEIYDRFGSGAEHNLWLCDYLSLL
jgi:hypothetical protein